MFSNRVMLGWFLPDITLVDDGDAAPTSGAGTTTHTYSAKTSTGPHTILCITSEDGAPATITGITWNAVPMTQLVLAETATGSNENSASIFYIAGAQNGDIVITFDENANDSHVTILSLDNLRSATPVDTDTATTAGAASLTLSALTAAPSGGIRIAVFSNGTAATAVTWTWVGHTEAADLSAGAFRHSVAYRIDDTAGGNITAAGENDRTAMAGVTLR